MLIFATERRMMLLKQIKSVKKNLQIIKHGEYCYIISSKCWYLPIKLPNPIESKVIIVWSHDSRHSETYLVKVSRFLG